MIGAVPSTSTTNQMASDIVDGTVIVIAPVVPSDTPPSKIVPLK